MHGRETDLMRAGQVPGFDCPAAIGDSVSQVETPALLIDLDAFERNLIRMRDKAAALGVALRPHAKMHKSADIARLQLQRGGATGFCCQKVSEAEALFRDGITNILISNEVVGARAVARLVALAARMRAAGGHLAVCADDPQQVEAYSRAVLGQRILGAPRDFALEVLVEIDCGGGRCGTDSALETVLVARAVDEAPGLRFGGLQAYNGPAQHVYERPARMARLDHSIALTRATALLLAERGLGCARITGAGTGSYEVEGASGLYTEIQPGSYLFMDTDYGRVDDLPGCGPRAFEQALFLQTRIISRSDRGYAVCDAGLKALAVDSGLPLVASPAGLHMRGLSDEHGTVEDPGGVLHLNDLLHLVPGHCDPTCNLHDWYVGIRGGLRSGHVECLWPVTARGRLF